MARVLVSSSIYNVCNTIGCELVQCFLKHLEYIHFGVRHHIFAYLAPALGHVQKHGMALSAQEMHFELRTILSNHLWLRYCAKVPAFGSIHPKNPRNYID
jgi:hypothetical protein